MPFTWQPDPIPNLDAPGAAQTINKNAQRLTSAHQTLDGTAVKAPTLGGGFVMAAGSLTITGSKTGIATGLTDVETVVASIATKSATNFWVTAQETPSNDSTIDIYVWQPTASGNNTPIACTTPVQVMWVVSGTSTASQ